MKLVLVSQDEYIKQQIDTNYTARNVALIHYRNPIKAIDNLDEIMPEMIIFSAEDFPRHWKPFVRLYREYMDRNEGVFILLTGELFPEEEATKATHLDVNGLVQISYDDTAFIDKLDEILSRYIDIEDIRSGKRYKPREYDQLEFVFNHPESKTLITGKILDISGLSVSFRPDNTQLTGDLENGTRISGSSLQIGNEIYDCSVEIVRNQGVIVFDVSGDAQDLQSIIRKYISEKSVRSLEHFKEMQRNIS